MTKKDFPELFDEMMGITNGLNAAGCKTNINEIIAWNFYCSIPYWFSTRSDVNPYKFSNKTDSHFAREGGAKFNFNKTKFYFENEGGAKEHCSAFIAVGDWTEDGKIVCAHNSFADYIDGQYAYVVLDIKPDKGHRIIMQTCPCWIWSGTDFFITSKGIIGTETTIGGFFPYEKRYPIGYRIRKAMQYGNTLDEYCEILLKENSGDYANSWLFGDINSNEILRIELGLNFHNIERTKNGYFIGFNAPYDERIRNFEVVNSGFYDIRRHQGARLVRLGDLMDEHKGKINIDIAKKIIADHYDVYLLKDNNPCSRTVCSHYDLDAREYMSDSSRPKPFAPRGATDGIVCDTNLAKKMSFVARYGNSCGIPFFKDEFCKKHRQYYKFCQYLKDRPTEPWTEFTIYDKIEKLNSKKSKTYKKTYKKTQKKLYNKKINKSKRNK